MDVNKMMKQVARMQRDLAKAQEELANQTVEGSAGGGTVKVVLSGSGDVSSVHIEPSAIDPDDPSLLEDLVVAAFHDATRAQRDLAEQMLGGFTSGLGLPGLP